MQAFGDNQGPCRGLNKNLSADDIDCVDFESPYSTSN